MNLNIQLNFRSDIPITNQVVEQIQTMIASGVLKPGDQLPTVRSLASDLRINFNTIARAYRILDEAGIISTQQGRGTYITEMPSPQKAEQVRKETLQALATRYITETLQLGYSIEQAVDYLLEKAEHWKKTKP